MRIVVVLVLAAALTACQLVDAPPDPTTGGATDPEDDAPALGSPAEDWPRTLAGMRAFAEPEALAWQDDPVLADLTVWVDPSGAWERVRLTYVAPDAERMLSYRSNPDELRLERPRLAGLQLPVLPAAAVQAIAPFPDTAMEPTDLAAAAAPALADCGADGPVRTVLFATGAPAAWDGQQWTRTPTWRATLLTESGGVVVDPASGQAFAPLTCVEPLLVDGE